MEYHIRGGPCRLVNVAFGKEDSIAVDRFQGSKPEILKSKTGKFPVTSFTSITGLLERAA
jgi:hypothetical protein